MDSNKPLVLITGAGGDIGSALTRALSDAYRVVGFDRKVDERDGHMIAADLGSDESVGAALTKLREQYGSQIAAVVHLAAYFDFTGEDNPLYETVNVEGTRRLLRGLQGFEVERLIYAGTMLVHRAGQPGDIIDEQTPIQGSWAYPNSKIAAEKVIAEEHGDIPYLLLHLAGLYDEQRCVPTLANQIARIYERDFQSHLYPGDTRAGQSFLHKQDMIDAFRRAIDRRNDLPPEAVILIGEDDAVGFGELQDRIGRLVHGEREWTTVEIPETIARVGAWLQEKTEPLVPDALDKGEKPFIRPFMVRMAEDHYALDISLAERLLGWVPQHNIRSSLPKIIESLKADPQGWYKRHGVSAPGWLDAAVDNRQNPEALRSTHATRISDEHTRNIWAHYLNIALASWLIASPITMGYATTLTGYSEMICGVLLAIFAWCALSPHMAWARWACAGIGCWLLMAPLLFWTPSAAAYLNNTLAGMLIIGFALLLPPTPGVSAVAESLGPTVPPGWSFSPSSWEQRVPIIVLAFVGLYLSRYMAAYQLGHIEGVWDPFFAGSPDPKNGTEEIITSDLSQAWPIPDAGLGAVTYALEILTGLLGSQRRWRTMPWLVVLFGMMIVPLGVVSIGFIIIQPILIGTWCTPCLIGAAAMLLQIPYSLDELLATGQFLKRRKRAGQSLLRVFFVGDTDEDSAEDRAFAAEQKQVKSQRAARLELRAMLTGGVGLPWNLLACIAVGIWLMLSRITVGAEGALANIDHVIGSLVLTVTICALSDIARALRYLNVVLGLALVMLALMFDGSLLAKGSDIVCGILLVALSLRRGPVTTKYGDWNRLIV